MQADYKSIKYISFSIIIAMGLVACGGGSSDNDDTDNGGGNGSGDGSASGGGAGSGDCVTFPRPVVGQKTHMKTVNVGRESDVKRTYTKVSNTSRTSTSTVNDSFTSTDTETFSIANNYIDFTKEVSEEIFAGTITDTDTTTFSPYRRAAIDRVCAGQEWTNTYTKTNSDGSNEVTVKNTIVSVNDSISVEAGTFNTFQTKGEIDSLGFNTTFWIDIATGVEVKMETRDSDNELWGESELISFSRP